MESPEFSMLSSLRGEFKSEDFIQPHYRESYRLAIDCLVKNGRDSYREFLKGERIGSFLSEEELLFITEHAEQPPSQSQEEEISGPADSQSSSGTYWPLHSDMDAPDLDLGWPEAMPDILQTNIDLLFHPARQNSPTIKEVVRKKIQEARQVIRNTCVQAEKRFVSEQQIRSDIHILCRVLINYPLTYVSSTFLPQGNYRWKRVYC